MTSVSWTQQDGKYLVSSADHLECIATSGAGFAPVSAPGDYTSASYIQTVDIDVTGRAVLIPSLSGIYDGGNFDIANCDGGLFETFTGLSTPSLPGDTHGFGCIAGRATNGAAISNVHVSGAVHLVAEAVPNMGVICGRVEQTTVSDCSVTGAAGSRVSGYRWVGGALGQLAWAFTSWARNITVGGFLDVESTGVYVGGVVGVSVKGFLEGLRMTATGNITSAETNAGGVTGGNQWGNVFGTTVAIRSCSNEMTGDITANDYAGGVVGRGGCVTEGLTNTMTGNIVATGGYAGGVIGGKHRDPYAHLYNGMTGDITGVNVGGIMGFINQDGSDGDLTDAVLCMNGNVQGGTGVGNNTGTLNNAYFSTTFGMTYDGAAPTVDPHLTFTSLDSLPTFSAESLLIELSPEGIPFWTYVLDEVADLPMYGGTPSVPTLYLSVSAVYANVSWSAVDGATSYRITVVPEGRPAFTLETATPSAVLSNLPPGTTFHGNVYYSTGGGFESHLEVSFTTPAFSGAEVATAFASVKQGDTYDLTVVDDVSEFISRVRTELQGGEKVALPITFRGQKVNRVATFVEAGGTAEVDDDVLFMPFDAGEGAGQSVTLEFPDNSSKVVTFDEAEERIVVDSVSYSPGERFILGGRVAEVLQV
ncbi:unnamed protein product [Chrysoparadoxa australica]